MTDTLLLLLLGFSAGLVGGTLGVGGGFILVPVFHTAMGWPLLSAVAGSQICVLSGSISATGRYLAAGLPDLRLGVLLEIPTMVGAAVGALLAYLLGEKVLTILFVLVATGSAVYMWIRRDGHSSGETGELAPRHVPVGMLLSVFAGGIASVLGVGGGILKVPIMSIVMRVPMRRVVATSTFMIGVTAATSAIVYHAKGSLILVPTATVAMGVMVGSELGARLQHKVAVPILKRMFALLLVGFALRMLWYTFLGN